MLITVFNIVIYINLPPLYRNSTDGLAIAHAVVDALAARRCPTLFATHFHLLTAAFAAQPCRVVAWALAIELDARTRRLTPLYKRVDGAALRSFGGDVALAAGVPSEVVARASQVARVAAIAAADAWFLAQFGAIARVVVDDGSSLNALRIECSNGLQVVDSE